MIPWFPWDTTIVAHRRVGKHSPNGRRNSRAAQATRAGTSEENSRSKTKHEEWQMLYWALVFFIIAISAGDSSAFSAWRSAAAGIAKIPFFVFLVLLVISPILGGWRRGPDDLCEQSSRLRQDRPAAYGRSASFAQRTGLRPVRQFRIAIADQRRRPPTWNFCEAPAFVPIEHTLRSATAIRASGSDVVQPAPDHLLPAGRGLSPPARSSPQHWLGRRGCLAHRGKPQPQACAP